MGKLRHVDWGRGGGRAPPPLWAQETPLEKHSSGPAPCRGRPQTHREQGLAPVAHLVCCEGRLQHFQPKAGASRPEAA